MKNLSLLIIVLFSCTSNNQPEVRNNKYFHTFLSNFKSISYEELKKTNLREFGKNDEIEEKYVLNYVCRNQNQCFYSETHLKNKYFYLFKTTFSENIVVLFYRKSEPPLSTKVYALSVDLNKKQVISSLLVSGKVPGKYEVSIEFNDDFLFKITRIYKKYKFGEIAQNENNKSSEQKKMYEVFDIDKLGFFNIKSRHIE